MFYNLEMNEQRVLTNSSSITRPDEVEAVSRGSDM